MSGLPRTGSTVLSAILSQNPKIHSGTASPVCPTMWDLTLGFSQSSIQEMSVANRPEFQTELIRNVPHLYYKDVNKPFIVDKSRDWLHPRNMRMIRNHINPDPKVLVLLRDKEAIIDSFTRVWKENGVTGGELKYLIEDATWKMTYYCEEIIPTVKASQDIIKGNNVYRGDPVSDNEQFLFIEYDKFMEDPSETLNSIYRFFKLEPYEHDFENIFPAEVENDSAIGSAWKNLHTVRPILEPVG